jgi:hypothetical protein
MRIELEGDGSTASRMLFLTDIMGLDDEIDEYQWLTAMQKSRLF